MLLLTTCVSVSSYVFTFNNLTTVECIFIKFYIGKIYEKFMDALRFMLKCVNSLRYVPKSEFLVNVSIF